RAGGTVLAGERDVVSRVRRGTASRRNDAPLGAGAYRAAAIFPLANLQLSDGEVGLREDFVAGAVAQGGAEPLGAVEDDAWRSAGRGEADSVEDIVHGDARVGRHGAASGGLLRDAGGQGVAERTRAGQCR